MIGPLREDEASAIAALHARLFERPWTEQEIASLLQHDATLALAARGLEPCEMDGFLIAFFAADELEIITIGVSPERQRRGIARQLLAALMEAGRQRSARRIFLEVAEDNLAALGLYAASGFVPAGRRAAYYHDGRTVPADALVLAKIL